jgi:hypothetical protein
MRVIITSLFCFLCLLFDVILINLFTIIFQVFSLICVHKIIENM